MRIGRYTKPMQTKKDFSYGIIPMRRVGAEWEVFLIQQFSRIGNNSYWVFPKGHPEGEETPLQTAVRELKEETDMVADSILSEPTFKLSYTFTYDKTKIEKTVVFFVGIITNDSFKLQADEVKEGGWYSLDKATERLDYKDTKQMFKGAYKFIKNYQPTQA